MGSFLTCELGHLILFLQVTFETGEKNLTLGRLEPVHYVGNGTLTVSLSSSSTTKKERERVRGS